MEEFKLQKPTCISQLFNALNSHFLIVNFVQIECSISE